MPIAVVQEWAEGGNDTTNYDRVHQRIMDGPSPDGFRVHTAGATEGGGFRIFEVWDSEEQYRRFVEEQLMPVVQERGNAQLLHDGEAVAHPEALNNVRHISWGGA